MFRRLAKAPFRKPLALLINFIAIASILRSQILDMDIPTNAANILLAMVTSVNGFYFLSSSYEACNGNTPQPKEEETDGDG
jgi:hypothetical protein